MAEQIKPQTTEVKPKAPEPKAPLPAPATPPAPTKEQALAHVEKIKEHLKSFEGKVGHNPFLYFKKAISSLRDRVKKGDTEAISQLLKIPVDVAPTQELLSERFNYAHGEDLSNEAAERKAKEQRVNKIKAANPQIGNLDNM
jgi:hypothetical protein